MPNMKGFIVFVLSLLFFVVVLASLFLYSLNEEDYTKWISEQIKQSTGYDIRFEVIESNWLTENRFSVLGLSLYEQQRPIIYISRVDIEIDNLDLWSRQLQVKNLHLQGVELEIDTTVVGKEKPLLNYQQNQLASPSIPTSNLEWEKLQLSHIQITDMNANIKHLDKTLSVKDANIIFKDVLLIDQQQLVKLPQQLDSSAVIKHLHFNDAVLKTELEDINVLIKAEPLKRQAEIDFRAANIQVKEAKYSPLLLNSLTTQLSLNANLLSLKHLSVEAFSGDLVSQAQAILNFNLLPKPRVEIEKIQIDSLNARNMQISMPNFSYFDSPLDNDEVQSELPINNFFIKSLNLQNMSLKSDIKQLPLNVKSAHLMVNDFEVIKDNKLWSMDSYSPQAGRFTLAFSYLSWQGTIIEDFSLGGSLNRSEQVLVPLI